MQTGMGAITGMGVPTLTEAVHQQLAEVACTRRPTCHTCQTSDHGVAPSMTQSSTKSSPHSANRETKTCMRHPLSTAQDTVSCGFSHGFHPWHQSIGTLTQCCGPRARVRSLDGAQFWRRFPPPQLSAVCAQHWAVVDAVFFCCGVIAEKGAADRVEDDLCKQNAVGCLCGGWARLDGNIICFCAHSLCCGNPNLNPALTLSKANASQNHPRNTVSALNHSHGRQNKLHAAGLLVSRYWGLF